MPKINLKHLSVADLVRLRDEIETALSGKIAMERDELQAKIDALGKFEAGRSPKSNGSARRGAAKRPNPAKGRKAAPKYKGPNGELWAGRGLAPKWLAALEKQGKKRDSYLIRK
ncbi:MAG TPA: H-NS histone family protein [Bauldia sp.]|nr:H-NS histone family protein [Bauldia sp.]